MTAADGGIGNLTAHIRVNLLFYCLPLKLSPRGRGGTLEAADPAFFLLTYLFLAGRPLVAFWHVEGRG